MLRRKKPACGLRRAFWESGPRNASGWGANRQEGTHAGNGRQPYVKGDFVVSEYLRKAQEAAASAETRVQGEYRPVCHLCAPVGWLNDPNGFGIFRGRYHLFYQYHPYAAVWGPMHWGHWSSGDLVRWRAEPVALAPDQPYDAEGCFSGTSLEVDGVFYLVYTGVSRRKADGICVQQQCLAMSRDGVHFEKYAGNPIISSDMLPAGAAPEDFRDPKLYRDAEGFHLVIASRGQRGGQLLRYTSADLLHWQYDGVFLQGLGEMAECPDLFAQDGRTVVVACLMHADAGRYGCRQPVVYTMGKARGGVFVPEQPFRQVEQGIDFYAPQSLKLQDGRQAMIGWAFTWEHHWPIQPHQWAGMMTLPRECRLEAGRLALRPLQELAGLRLGQGSQERPGPLQNGCRELTSCAGRCKEMVLELLLSPTARMTLSLMQTGAESVRLTYDAAACRLRLDTTAGGIPLKDDAMENCRQQCEASLALREGRLKLHIFVDVSILEVYANDGEAVMTALVFPKGKGYGVSLQVEGMGTLERCESWKLGPVMQA